MSGRQRSKTRSRKSQASSLSIWIEFPPEYDYSAYVQHPLNPTLQNLDEAQALWHYHCYGREEGRPCSPIDSRPAFQGLIGGDRSLLEIGPFCTPAFTRASHDVRFLDVFTTEELRTKSRALTWADPEKVPEIDYVWRGQDYASLIDHRFEAVFSSHNIEHQTCLVTHLRDVASILRPGGRFFLAIPDKRYCFDYFIAETTIADILDAYLSGRTTHAARSLASSLLLAHNEAEGHWRGEHGADPRRREINGTFVDQIKGFIDSWRAQPDFQDTHAWQFTPDSFRYLTELLFSCDLSPLRLERLYQTIRPSNEFYAILLNPNDQPEKQKIG